MYSYINLLQFRGLYISKSMQTLLKKKHLYYFDAYTYVGVFFFRLVCIFIHLEYSYEFWGSLVKSQSDENEVECLFGWNPWRNLFFFSLFYLTP